MKKSWIIVLAFVFLWSAVPAFSAPLPVPSKLCLHWMSYNMSFRLLLKSEGKIEGVEYFGALGSYVSVMDELDAVLKGGAHRKGKKILHLGLMGVDTWNGPGGDSAGMNGYDIRYNLKKEKGVMSYVCPEGNLMCPGTDTLVAFDCSLLPPPPY